MRPFGAFLLLLALAMPVTPVRAAPRQVINVAHATWGTAAATRTLDSNPVVLAIEPDEPAASTATLTAWRADAGSSVRVPAVVAQCRASSGTDVPLSLGKDAGASVALSPISTIRAGETLVFELKDAAGNRDPVQAETMAVTLTTPSGDREALMIAETGADTGVFVGLIHTAANAARTPGNCTLDLAASDTVRIDSTGGAGQHAATVTVDVLVDPYGIVFDAADGTPVDGVRVTLVDAATGLPASVVADDGHTPWPATVTTGGTVVSGTMTYRLPSGEYRFPLAARGRYRLAIEPPAPYTAPSTAPRAGLASLRRPDGLALALSDASWGAAFALAEPAPVRIDVPIDRPTIPAELSKTASVAEAQAGDIVRYTIVLRNADPAHAQRAVIVRDTLPAALRLKPDTLRVDGALAPTSATIAPDGRSLAVALGTVAPGATRTISYALQVRADAADGQAINRAVAIDARGIETVASVAVRIHRETITGRMTIVGRIAAGACGTDPGKAAGVAGVRVMMEDGSYALTDRDGRYHFEGVVPGTHVVRVDAATLGVSGRLVDCGASVRSAGNAASRFVTGRGGSLVVADFRAVPGERADDAGEGVPAAPSDKAASGAERDWFADGAADVAWLFPEADHNPRAPAVRVAIRHLPGQKVALFADGRPVDGAALDGTRVEPQGRFAVTLWRGVPLQVAAARLSAEIRASDGALVTTLTRDIHLSAAAARATFVADRSRLVADGIHRPLIALRLVDRDGRPVRAGSVGEVRLSAPYEAAEAIDAEQARVLSGLERAAPSWRVAGDDGIATIALAPTTTSGSVTLDFTFRDRDQVRTQRIEAWLAPGDRPWTIVGLAQGSVGLGTLRDHLEPLAGDERPEVDGRIAFYAKGRVRGRWLLTLAYDSDRKRGEQRLSGQIDPNTYYTVYADRSERRFDAASTRKLYVKLETRQFYALFGDFTTGFDQTELARYVRTPTGAKAEFRSADVAGSAFAARISTRHRRDEIQGSGLTGPYSLRARSIVANSEQVTIEVRDRLRSERIVERRSLTRFVDYDIDYAAGTLRFSSPVLSRTSELDPQFIVVDYEVDPLGSDATVAGARATAAIGGDRLRLGATVLTDRDEDGRTGIVAVDARARLSDATELRAEIAASHRAGAGTAAAFRVEAEHHDGRLDVLAYVRQQGVGYGVEQQNAAERGRRKVGVEARLRVSEHLSATATAWTDDDLASAARRRAGKLGIEYHDGAQDLRLGVTHADDRTDEIGSATSTLVEASATRRVLDRVELTATTGFALDKAASVDFPVRHRIGARWQVRPGVALVGGYEIAKGDAVDARTVRTGFDLQPWEGAKLTSALADQDIGEYGRRAYAAYGLAQSLQLGERWSIDATVDGNRTLGGVDPATIIDPAHPVAFGGHVASGDIVTEDFTALTLGATLRAGAWSATARAEHRFSDLGNRSALTAGLLRRLGEGRVLGGLLTWAHATRGATATTSTNAALSFASRPAGSHLAVLGKLEWREDGVTGAVAGTVAPVGGGTLLVSGDARSRRVIGSIALDWSPNIGGGTQRSEVSLFVGGRYVSDRLFGDDLGGFTTILGLDGRLGLHRHVELGLGGTIRGDLSGGYGWSLGPIVTIAPFTDAQVTLGWNLRGFVDHDFTAMRQTQAGPFVTLRMKLDENSLGIAGMLRR